MVFLTAITKPREREREREKKEVVIREKGKYSIVRMDTLLGWNGRRRQALHTGALIVVNYTERNDENST
jgi:hypothetical protein